MSLVAVHVYCIQISGRRRRLYEPGWTLADVALEMKEKEKTALADKVDLPSFGISPGPTPTVTPTSTPTLEMSEEELSVKVSGVWTA